MTRLLLEEVVQAPEVPGEAPPKSKSRVALGPKLPDRPKPFLRLAAVVQQAETPLVSMLHPVETGHSGADRRVNQPSSGLVVRIRFREEVSNVTLPLLGRAFERLKGVVLLGVAAVAVAASICWLAPR
jgi:hypothetical protein